MHPLIKDLCGIDPEKVAAALQAASSRRDELLPEIITELTRVVEDPESWEEDSNSPIFLYYLGAEWRDARVYDLLIRALSLPGERIIDLLGEFVDSGAGEVLAATWDGDLTKLEALARLPEADSFARGAALDAVMLLVDRQVIPRAEGFAFFKRVTSDLDPTDFDDVELASMAVGDLLDLRAVEMREWIEKLFDQGLVDPTWSGSKEETIKLLMDPASPTMTMPQPIDNAWETVSDWSFFAPKEDDEPFGDGEGEGEGEGEEPVRLPELLARDTFVLPSAPFVAPPVPGRNDPCSCGSGKKYKKCCG